LNSALAATRANCTEKVINSEKEITSEKVITSEGAEVIQARFAVFI
jgi:hypothetical protein